MTSVIQKPLPTWAIVALVIAIVGLALAPLVSEDILPTLIGLPLIWVGTAVLRYGPVVLILKYVFLVRRRK